MNCFALYLDLVAHMEEERDYYMVISITISPKLSLSLSLHSVT